MDLALSIFYPFPNIFKTTYVLSCRYHDWHKRQCDIRGMFAVMQNHLVSHGKLFVDTKIMTSVGVAIPAREVAAGYIQANAMASFKDVTRRPEIDFILVSLAGLKQRRIFTLREATIASTDDAIGQVLRIAIGMDIHQSRHKIGIWCA